MRIAVIMDPIEQVSVDKDTSFALMLRAQELGHEVFYLSHRDLWLENATLHLQIRPVSLQRAERPLHASVGASRVVTADDLDAILIRTDPPFNDAYLYTTLLLEHARGRALVLNDPRGLREANEKLYAMHFPSVTPKTIVASDASVIRGFTERMGGRAVLKPLDGNGGRGIFILSLDDLNYRSIIESSTQDGRNSVMVQEYLPDVRTGDKRILLLEGEPIGAILRVPRSDDARSNIHVGGTVQHTEITENEMNIVRSVAPRLRKDGLYFVGLDVIGERLTEVNVTSPTGIQEMSRFTNSDPEGKVIRWIEQRATRVKQAG